MSTENKRELDITEVSTLRIRKLRQAFRVCFRLSEETLMIDATAVAEIKIPKDCSKTELNDFVTLVAQGDEVISDGLEARVTRARALVFFREQGDVIGIAALKTPYRSYVEGVFRKAQATHAPDKFALELGWIFLETTARGRGLCNQLISTALSVASRNPVFATARIDNEAMHHILPAHGFSVHGLPYPSDRSSQMLRLFVRIGKESSSQS